MRRYRIYFNRAAAAPLIWSYDEGSHSTEVNVASFVITAGVVARSNFDLTATGEEPKAWIEVRANFELIAGVAYFTPGAP